MDRVYLLYHTHGDEDEIEENRKLIGIFSTPERAVQTRDSVRDKPGFRDYPDGFEIVDHRLDNVGWVDGFVSDTINNA